MMLSPGIVGSGKLILPPAVADVFSANLWTQTSADQNLYSSIPDPDLLWLKSRTGAASFSDHTIWDKARPGTGTQPFASYLSPSSTAGEQKYPDGNSSPPTQISGGYKLYGSSFLNTGTDAMVTWSFKKHARFMNIIKYTGNGVIGRLVPHGLGVTPGLVLIKSLSTINSWCVWHRNFPANNQIDLNSTGASYDRGSSYGIRGVDANNIELGAGAENNSTGDYIAYVFAHDTHANGVVQCGSVTMSGTTYTNLGWQPQYILTKNVTSTGNWYVADTARGITSKLLYPNTGGAEASAGVFTTDSTGFSILNGSFTNGHSIIYMAIRA